jgi:hypothetical protein
LKYFYNPTSRPELIRARVTVTKRDGDAPTTPSADPTQQQPTNPTGILISLQVSLNKNFNVVLENMQVMASLSAFSDILSGAGGGGAVAVDVKSRPSGHYQPTQKILTWRCGNVTPQKQPMLQMEAFIPTSQLNLSKYTSPSVPIIAKAVINGSSLVPDVTFELKADEFRVVTSTSFEDGKQETISTSKSIDHSAINRVASVISRVEYRFI